MEATREIPRIRGNRFLGSLLDFKKAPHEFMANSCSPGHSLIQFRMINREMIGIVGSDCAEAIFKQKSQNFPRGKLRKSLESLLGLGLVNLEGEEWKNHRRMVAQAFKPDFLKYTLNQNSILVTKLLDDWANKATRNMAIDAADEMRIFTMSVIIKALFSTDLNLQQDQKTYKAIADANDLMFKHYTSLLKFPDWVRSPLNVRLAEARQSMNIYTALQFQKKMGNPDRQSGDMGDHFLELQDKGVMSFEEIYDEIRTLLVAGFETTATALAWTLYLIAKNPQVTQKWHKELDEQLGSEPPTWENISKLKFTEHLLMEGLRLYPPVYMISRVCLQDDVVHGYFIPADSPVILSIYAIQRSPEYWDKPDQFIPERFASDWPEHAFIPFGVGKHICIGSRFSMLESILILACIGQRFNISLARDENINPDAKVTLIPSGEISLKLESRTY